MIIACLLDRRGIWQQAPISLQFTRKQSSYSFFVFFSFVRFEFIFLLFVQFPHSIPNIIMFRQVLNAGKTQVARGYATSAPSTKAPIALFGIDGKYATALFQAAASKNALTTVEADLNNISEKLAQNARIGEVLSSPLLNRSAKEELINSLGKKSELTTNFFKTLIENNRLSETNNIITAFKSLMDAQRGIVSVIVTSATQLGNKELKQVKDSLTKGGLIKDFKEVNVINKVNPSLLGGMVVEFGDYTIDMSVSSRLAKLEKLLTDSIAV
ncbi:ATP synthase delta subunit-domain-containing protein [Kickxella alabastrina]|uniref:ATP synthase delta subunit-domain-containing protein n=1 Tax=Kickxella alabastrina TaxID=61397 RepID=UPI00221F9282|nr:ATP synthase delta subunit-domain-containing protein [Kickxella alabastrina]KAI7833450.1 ATP synthase delta subunit-domain-containing protein [Kickxella alabastrina]